MTSLRTEAYLTQSERWPAAGRHILAQYDDDTVVVYQAYRPSIGAAAVADGRLGGGGFSFERMSWIKPNFLWMMFRSGWGTKPEQEVTLAVTIRREGFDAILAEAVHSGHVPEVYGREIRVAGAAPLRRPPPVGPRPRARRHPRRAPRGPARAARPDAPTLRGGVDGVDRGRVGLRRGAAPTPACPLPRRAGDAPRGGVPGARRRGRGAPRRGPVALVTHGLWRPDARRGRRAGDVTESSVSGRATAFATRGDTHTRR